VAIDWADVLSQLNLTEEDRNGLVVFLFPTIGSLLADKDAQIAQLEADVAAKDGEITQLNTDVAAKDGEITQLNTDLAAKDGEITQLNTDLAAKDVTIAALEADLVAKGVMITQLEADVADRDATIAGLTADLAARDATIAVLEADVADKDASIAALEGERDTCYLLVGNTYTAGHLLMNKLVDKLPAALIQNYNEGRPSADFAKGTLDNVLAVNVKYDTWFALSNGGVDPVPVVPVDLAEVFALVDAILELEEPGAVGKVIRGN
jgi:uncharacterized coiled-coil protein SlyX